tara:strand:- start:5 stop:793 length:789 start_codon:yes stop_codon:yes gene_type:complete
MAKKQETKAEVPAKTPVMEAPKNNWELKDRVYILTGNKTPLTFTLKSRNLMWFDEDLGYERELKYAENQKSVFVDEQVGDARLSHITFKDGSLMVPKEKVSLQKLLSLYHPWKNKYYYEFDEVKVATSEIDTLELELDAMNTARDMDIEMLEAIMRVEVGSKVTEMSSKELKRDALIYAKKNPKLFLDLAKDENIHLRNLGIKATEMGILKLSRDQRTFMWGSNDRKLMNVPFDEHPYTALAAWFKTDEGMEILKNIEKQLS